MTLSFKHGHWKIDGQPSRFGARVWLLQRPFPACQTQAVGTGMANISGGTQTSHVQKGHLGQMGQVPALFHVSIFYQRL